MCYIMLRVTAHLGELNGKMRTYLPKAATLRWTSIFSADMLFVPQLHRSYTKWVTGCSWGMRVLYDGCEAMLGGCVARLNVCERPLKPRTELEDGRPWGVCIHNDMNARGRRVVCELDQRGTLARLCVGRRRKKRGRISSTARYDQLFSMTQRFGRCTDKSRIHREIGFRRLTISQKRR